MYRKWSGSLGGDGGSCSVVGDGRALHLPLVVKLAIFGFREKKR